ncbi:MAG TPA: TonB-dependent receptor, partial [Myxococcaceae bacterium]|nr:TonB-dependent receptor [Myxococcaceae bacterium]
VTGFGFSGEGRAKATSWLDLTLGADFVEENHLFQTFDKLSTLPLIADDGTVIRPVGSLLPGEARGRRGTFQNVGAYAQASAAFQEAWYAVVGARLDVHNIYGANPSVRSGIVHAPPDRPYSLKLLYGSSFKAPSAVQLYTQPIAVGDLQGNPQLKAQTAHTFEVSSGLKPSSSMDFTFNLFATNVRSRVEFLQRGAFFQANNSKDEWVAGGEVEAQVVLVQGLKLRGSASVAKTLMRSEDITFLTGAPEVDNPLFPTYQTHLTGDWKVPRVPLRLSAEVSYIGPRESSQSNALEKGEAYALPGYVYTAVALSTSVLKLFGRRETQAALRVVNPLGRRWTEPGFGGVDIPNQGVTAYLTLNQSI